jgi:DNA-binding IclR family transcriptional regulator
MPDTGHRPTIRVLDILELLATNPNGLTLTELANITGASKSTLMPVVHTLAHRKFISLDKTTYQYRIGISAYCIGASYSDNKTTLQFIQTEMKEITARSGEICQMGIFDNGQILYIAKIDSDKPVRIISYIGKRIPAYCTALGKAILSTKTMEEIKNIYPKGLLPLTQNTVTDFDALERQLAEINSSGFAYECGEVIEQTECIAVPLLKNNISFAAISVSIPTFRSTPEKRELICTLLKDMRYKFETFLNSNDIDIDSLRINV